MECHEVMPDQWRLVIIPAGGAECDSNKKLYDICGFVQNALW
ncbi:hypothetical protein TH47_07630 [Thalassospira sp. MCCC 1A02803]|nr:hypothetical protein TH47_07630 [Thalassospira sp. MCCC 1A02803]